jgi:large subunit ribosomal protein L17
MRHGKTFNHLGRTATHRKSLLSNMATSLILHKRITTTVAKAKELRKYIEPLITKSKDDSTHSRRIVFSYLKSKESTAELFGAVAQKVADRPGGYTRILKLMNRKGDNAEMAIIELVDFNENLLKDKSTKTATKRTRRGKKTAAAETTTEATSEEA